MKHLSFIILLCLVATILKAQTINGTIKPPRPKVGVVLGGGGAKGASHIGALKYIEEIGIPVDYVAGTSMGSIIGGLYAMGYEPDEMQRLISNIHWNEMIGNSIDREYLSKDMRECRSTLALNIPFGDGSLRKQLLKGNVMSQLPSAYVNNSSLVNLFNDLCIGYPQEMDFNDMPIPFACVATDLISGQEVVLRQGSMPTALRASMAIPGVFTPIDWGDYLLVDGGLVNNFPADVLREMGADIIIGIEVTDERKVSREDLKSLPQVMGRLVVNVTNAKRQGNRKLCNIRIVPDVTGFGMLSFTPEAIDTLVQRGYKKAEEYHDQLMAIKSFVDKEAGHPIRKELRAPRAHDLADTPVFITSIDIHGVSDRESRWLIRKGHLDVGKTLTKDKIEEAMSIYRGTGCFDEVTYTIKEHDSLHQYIPGVSLGYALQVNVKPAAPHVMGLGLRYDTEEGAALLLSVNMNEKRFGSSKFGISAKLSYNPRLHLKYTYSRSSLANFNVSLDYRNEHFRSKSIWDKYVNLHYRQTKVNAYITEFHMLNFSTNVGASYFYTTYDRSSSDNNPFDSVYYSNNAMLAPYVSLQYDNLDDSYFAKHGIQSSLCSHFYYQPSNKEKLFDISYDFKAYITPHDGRFTIIPQVYGRYVTNTRYFNLENTCGGEVAGRHFENQMPFVGLTSVEDLFTTNNTSILRCDLRYNFYGKHYLTAMYNYLLPWGIVGHGGAMFIDMFNFAAQGAGLKYSYNSLIGPISLTGHWYNYYGMNSFGAYFSFGYTF